MGFYELAEKALALEKEGKKVVRLNVGNTNLPTPRCATDAAVGSMERLKSGYCSSAGLPELRQKIAEREGCDVDNVVVGPGSKHLLYGLLSTLCRKGDTVSFPAPYWPAYGLSCRQLGLKAHEIKTTLDTRWEFEPAKVMARRPKLLLICNPLNPTSTIYAEKTMRDAIAGAQDAGMHVVLDEAYKGLAFRDVPRYEGETVIRVRSFSKEFSMEGWRLGYVVASEEVAKKLISFNQVSVTCVAPFVQQAGIACLENEKAILEENRKAWLSRSEAAQNALAKAGFRFAKPDAGIYVFATHPDMKDSCSFAMDLLDRESIAVVPGSEFGGYNSFVRICVNQPEDVLADAIGRMGRYLENAQGI
ncbi:pyridoxal phosphate-dependent aminotransferase [Candidatus Micrarchaeota archaeon]|nr:pyridoxal phosphate-dependent aminotransferase [Candidatus Micrarchaeota archaeon]